MSTPSRAETIGWIAHAIARVQRHHRLGTPLPSGAPLTFAIYVRLVKCVLGEHRED